MPRQLAKSTDKDLFVMCRNRQVTADSFNIESKQLFKELLEGLSDSLGEAGIEGFLPQESYCDTFKNIHEHNNSPKLWQGHFGIIQVFVFKFTKYEVVFYLGEYTLVNNLKDSFLEDFGKKIDICENKLKQYESREFNRGRANYIGRNL